MKTLNTETIGKKPLMAFFLQPFPSSIYQKDDDMVFNPVLKINETPKGVPLFTMARMSLPPTSCNTPGHMVKAGYTSSGKWRPARAVPRKSDKRAGK